MNMQISHQHTQVGHEFEHWREREITAVRDSSIPPVLALIDRESATEPDSDNKPDYDLHLSPELQITKQLIESISGKQVETYGDIYNYQGYLKTAQSSFTLIAEQNPDVFQLDGQLVSGNSQITVKESLFESERLDYTTSLTLSDEQGYSQELAFSFSLRRELNISRELSMTVAEFKDPLIVNLDNNPELLGTDTTDFDLEGDGIQENIPQLNSGVWYLAYDRNQNGLIDNGLELFGARSGQGFAELGEFDSDANGIIDKGDTHFSDLTLWNGSNRQQSLFAAGIKAISLNATDTPFTFTDPTGNPRAQLRQTSVFLTHQNSLGAVHQIDFAV